MQFKLESDFKPTGDQPEAIKELSQGILSSEKYQTLLGVTGSGKTFTVANVIQEIQRPTPPTQSRQLMLSPPATLSKGSSHYKSRLPMSTPLLSRTSMSTPLHENVNVKSSSRSPSAAPGGRTLSSPHSSGRSNTRSGMRRKPPAPRPCKQHGQACSHA